MSTSDCFPNAKKPVLDEDTGPFRHVVWAVGGTLVGLHQFPDPKEGAFDERRVGLDHLAFACSNRAELQEWEARLNEIGIAHGGIVDASYGSGLSFRDPDNLALEFFAPPSPLTESRADAPDQRYALLEFSSALPSIRHV